MKGAKALDGKRVRIMVRCETKGGAVFEPGEEGTFYKRGVVECSFKTDDGREIRVGHFSRKSFVLVE